MSVLAIEDGLLSKWVVLVVWLVHLLDDETGHLLILVEPKHSSGERPGLSSHQAFDLLLQLQDSFLVSYSSFNHVHEPVADIRVLGLLLRDLTGRHGAPGSNDLLINLVESVLVLQNETFEFRG